MDFWGSMHPVSQTVDNLTCWCRTTRTPSWSGPPAQQKGTFTHDKLTSFWFVSLGKWYEPWPSSPVRCCRGTYQTDSCRGGPAQWPGTARWTQMPMETVTRRPWWASVHTVRLVECVAALTCRVICQTQSMNWTKRGERSELEWFSSPWPTRYDTGVNMFIFFERTYGVAFKCSDLQQQTCVQSWSIPSPLEPAGTHKDPFILM